MRMRFVRTAILSSVLFASAAYAATATCFRDGLQTQHTGRSQAREHGRLVELKCPWGHSSWIRG